MPTPGFDCEIVLDGTGYFLKPGSYRLRLPRLASSAYRADGSLAYTDFGPGRRAWSMTILARNELTRSDGQPTGLSGQQYRDFLRASYASLAPLSFSDPLGGAPILVHFAAYEETILDLHSPLIPLSLGASAGATYEIAIELLEA